MNNNEVFDEIKFTINTALNLSTFSTEKRKKIKGLNNEFRVEIKCESRCQKYVACENFSYWRLTICFFG